jgi:hypothetical protein
MSGVISSVALQLEAQGLNSIVAGFSFASALAWYEVVKAMVAKLAKVGGGGIKHDLIAALITTLLAIFVYMIVKNFVKNVDIKEPSQTIFAVTR